MADQKIKMDVDETLELDYLVEDVSRDIVNINKNPNGLSKSYYSTDTFVFDPSGTGIYEIEIKNQVIEIEVTDIPDSVLYQWDFIDNFSQGDTTVEDSVGSVDMSLTGDHQDATIGGESGAEGDGTDDYGTAAVANIGQNETFGWAGTFILPSVSSFKSFWGVSDSGGGSNRVALFTGGNGPVGSIEIQLASSSEEDNLRKYTDNTFDDGTVHSCVINKNGDNTADVNIYVDDMTTAKPASTVGNDSFSHSQYSQSRDVAFWARNNGGTITEYLNVTFGVIEFNSEPYSQTERENFATRRPEV
jgi:hypothetical protein